MRCVKDECICHCKYEIYLKEELFKILTLFGITHTNTYMFKHWVFKQVPGRESSTGMFYWFPDMRINFLRDEEDTFGNRDLGPQKNTERNIMEEVCEFRMVGK